MYDFFDEDGNIRYEMYGNNTLANYQQRQAESGFKLKEYKEPRFSNYLSMLRIYSNTNRGYLIFIFFFNKFAKGFFSIKLSPFSGI